jgi:hypothetical protein
MSFDPSGYSEQTPPPSGRPPHSSPPAGPTSDVPGSGGAARDEDAPRARARERVLFPAVFLIIVGLLNFLPGGYLLVNAAVVRSMSTEKFQEMVLAQNPKQKEQFDQIEKQGYTAGDIKRIGEYFCWGAGGGGFIASLFTIIGAIRMIQLRNYGLAVFGSLVAAVPCLSGLACCGVGEGIAIWSIIVLLQSDIRSAFR